MIESRLAATRAADPLPIVSEAGKPEVAIEPSGVQHGFAVLSSVNHSPILLGTSSFTATGWQGSFYPKGLRPADYLSYYAQHFDTVEIDSTFYATPNVSVVRSWNAKTPEGFLFAAKVPQEITHKRVLKDCDEEFKVFLTTMEGSRRKAWPLVVSIRKVRQIRVQVSGRFSRAANSFSEKTSEGAQVCRRDSQQGLAG